MKNSYLFYFNASLLKREFFAVLFHIFVTCTTPNEHFLQFLRIKNMRHGNNKIC